MPQSETWTVRRAGGVDVDALSLIGRATFLETFAGVLDGDAIVQHCSRQHSAETYRAFITAGAGVWIAEARTGGAPIGFALSSTSDLPASRAGDLELKRIYALSRFHGSGLGAALLADVLEDAQDRADRLLLGVYAQNHRALAFYRKHGFEPIDTRRFDVGGTQYDDTVLARSLTG